MYKNNLLKWIKLPFLLVVCTVLIISACDQAVDSDTSDIDEDPPADDEEPIERKTENLIVITLDGVRWQEVFTGADSYFFPKHIGYIAGDYEEVKGKYWADTEEERRKKLMPYLWNELVFQGQLYGNRDYGNKVNVTNSSLKSFPGYCEIWNGYADPRITDNRPALNYHPTVLEFLNQQENLQGENIVITAAASTMADVFHADTNDFVLSAGHKDQTVFNKTMRALKNDHPRVVYMSINKTDHWAHQFEYDTYLNLIQEADSFIKEVWEFVQKDEFYRDKTTLIITTDHGRGVEREWHTHGAGDIEHADETWLVVAGPDTKSTGEQKEENQIEAIQFAKTMAVFLGFDFNTGKAKGEPIESAMSFKEE